MNGLVKAIREFMEFRDYYEGTPSELLKELQGYKDEYDHYIMALLKSPVSLSKALKRHSETFKHIKIEVEVGIYRNRQRLIAIRKKPLHALRMLQEPKNKEFIATDATDHYQPATDIKSEDKPSTEAFATAATGATDSFSKADEVIV